MTYFIHLGRYIDTMDYKYKTKYAEKECKAASMFDINTAIMRCLTKNLAMFGLGLYIYAGEDIPSVEVDSSKPSDNDMSWVNAIKEDAENSKLINDPVYLTRIQLFIKEGY